MWRDDDGECKCLWCIFEVKTVYSREMAVLMAGRSAASVCGVDGEKLFESVRKKLR